MSMTRQAHLIGSVGLDSAEAVFTMVADVLGDCCPRIPDGETGDRGYWIRWQQATFDRCEGLTIEDLDYKLPGYKDNVRRSFFRLRDGVEAAEVDLGDLGYADEALESYAVFARLQDEGRIPAGTRFLVAVPTPIALVCGFIMPSDQLAIEPAVEAAMERELAKIQAGIPADKLSIQLDVCFEVVGTDGGPALPCANPVDDSVPRIGRLCGLINDGVELGIHLCYGDPGHQHIVEPQDLGTCVAFANGIFDKSPRRVDFIHMPVPRGRGDEGYFRPLEDMRLPNETRLILGLVHHTDGVNGTRARMAVADEFAGDYDVATECGFGRRDPSTIPELLKVHREICA